MDGLRYLKTRAWLMLALALLLLANSPNLRADETAACLEKKAVGNAAQRWDALVKHLQNNWNEIRSDLTQSALEATVTAFFITWGSAPVEPLAVLAVTTPPDPSGGDPSTPPPPPPPPDGQGEIPTTDLSPPPPPTDAPEPTSMASALLGLGLASVIAWRKRRKRRAISAG